MATGVARAFFAVCSYDPAAVIYSIGKGVGSTGDIDAGEAVVRIHEATSGASSHDLAAVVDPVALNATGTQMVVKLPPAYKKGSSKVPDLSSISSHDLTTIVDPEGKGASSPGDGGE